MALAARRIFISFADHVPAEGDNECGCGMAGRLRSERAERERLSGEVETLESTKAKLETALAEAETRAREATSKLQRGLSTLRDAERRATEEEKLRRSVDKELAHVRYQVSLQDAYTLADRGGDAASRVFDGADPVVAPRSLDPMDQIDALERNRAKLTKNMMSLRRDYDDVVDRLSSKSRKVSKLRSELKLVDTQMEALRSERDELKRDVEYMRRAVDAGTPIKRRKRTEIVDAAAFDEQSGSPVLVSAADLSAIRRREPSPPPPPPRESPLSPPRPSVLGGSERGATRGAPLGFLQKMARKERKRSEKFFGRAPEASKQAKPRQGASASTVFNASGATGVRSAPSVTYHRAPLPAAQPSILAAFSGGKKATADEREKENGGVAPAGPVVVEIPDDDEDDFMPFYNERPKVDDQAPRIDAPRPAAAARLLTLAKEQSKRQSHLVMSRGATMQSKKLTEAIRKP